jgi:hypothetical protein
MVAAIDAALRFAGSRKVLASTDVGGVFAMLRVASPVAHEPGPVCEALNRAQRSFVDRDVISSTDVADGLLDVRLAVREPLAQLRVASSNATGAFRLARM